MKRFYFFWGMVFLPLFSGARGYDVTVVGLIGTENTMPLVSTSIIDILQKKLSVNVLSSRLSRGVMVGRYSRDISFNIKKISIGGTAKSPISLLTDVIWYKDESCYKNVPQTPIKLAYSMFEASALPRVWVNVLNEVFDAVIVPHESLIAVYQQAGVTIPIFELSLPMYLEPFLKKPLKKSRSRGRFVFGISAGFSERKNYDVLLRAFSREFKNDKNVVLKIHGSWGDKKRVATLVKQLKLTNVIIINRMVSRADYCDFIFSCDCYVFPSKGEGFSLTPREALACGIPCILSCHTVHRDLCRLPSVIALRADIREAAYFDDMDEVCGSFYQIRESDLQKALRLMYTRYPYYLKKNAAGRNWVKQYLHKNLAKKFVTLIKPAKVVLGNYNAILDTQLVTNDYRLYEKYHKYVLRKIAFQAFSF